MSDHSMSYMIWKGKSSKSEPRFIQYRNMNKLDIGDFTQQLMDQPWHSVKDCSSLDDAVYKWEELLMQVVNEHICQ